MKSRVLVELPIEGITASTEKVVSKDVYCTKEGAIESRPALLLATSNILADSFITDSDLDGEHVIPDSFLEETVDWVPCGFDLGVKKKVVYPVTFRVVGSSFNGSVILRFAGQNFTLSYGESKVVRVLEGVYYLELVEGVSGCVFENVNVQLVVNGVLTHEIRSVANTPINSYYVYNFPYTVVAEGFNDYFYFERCPPSIYSSSLSIYRAPENVVDKWNYFSLVGNMNYSEATYYGLWWKMASYPNLLFKYGDYSYIFSRYIVVVDRNNVGSFVSYRPVNSVDPAWHHYFGSMTNIFGYIEYESFAYEMISYNYPNSWVPVNLGSNFLSGYSFYFSDMGDKTLAFIQFSDSISIRLVVSWSAYWSTWPVLFYMPNANLLYCGVCNKTIMLIFWSNDNYWLAYSYDEGNSFNLELLNNFKLGGQRFIHSGYIWVPNIFIHQDYYSANMPVYVWFAFPLYYLYRSQAGANADFEVLSPCLRVKMTPNIRQLIWTNSNTGQVCFSV